MGSYTRMGIITILYVFLNAKDINMIVKALSTTKSAAVCNFVNFPFGFIKT